MFCRNCGTQIGDTDSFCINCGAKNEAIAATGASAAPAGNRKKLGIILGAVAGMAAVTVVLVLLLGGGGYTSVLDDYYEAHENNDPDLMYSSVIAQYWIDYRNEGWGNSAYETIAESIEDRIDEWDCGENIEITYTVISERRATEEQLEDLEDNLYDWYAYYVYERDEFEITDAYVLDIDFTVSGEEGTESFHYPDGLLVIEENGEWRIPRGQINCSFYSNQ